MLKKNSKIKIIVAHGHTSIETMHSLIPLLNLSNQIKNFEVRFVQYNNCEIERLEGDLIILVRLFHHLDANYKSNIDYMISKIIDIKKKFSKVIYFDDSAAISHILFFLTPYLDSYWVRGLFSNLDLYSTPFYGGRSFSHFYYEKYNIKDNKSYFSPVNTGNFPKNIRIAWNIGIGCYPTQGNKIINYYYEKIRKMSCLLSYLPSTGPLKSIVNKYKLEMIKTLSKPLDLSSRKRLISARFSDSGYYKSIGFHRKLIINKIKNDDNFLKGRIPKRQYLKECNSVLGLLSPFGWGEICYRDFEAAISCNLLIKPTMDHLVTWPNIYEDNSYLKLDWEFTNIAEVTEAINSDDLVYSHINNSREIYIKALNQCDDRAKDMINDVLKN